MEIKFQLDATDDFYCRSYCLLNMFWAPLCPSSGTREYYTGGCCLSYLVLWFASCQYGMKTRAPNTTGSNHLYNTLELLMMGIVVPKTCWTSSKICNKNHLLHLVGILFPHTNNDARSKPHQNHNVTVFMKSTGGQHASWGRQWCHIIQTMVHNTYQMATVVKA